MRKGRIEKAESITKRISQSIVDHAKVTFSPCSWGAKSSGRRSDRLHKKKSRSCLNHVTVKELNQHFAVISTDQHYTPPLSKAMVTVPSPSSSFTEYRVFRMLHQIKYTAPGLRLNSTAVFLGYYLLTPAWFRAQLWVRWNVLTDSDLYSTSPSNLLFKYADDTYLLVPASKSPSLNNTLSIECCSETSINLVFMFHCHFASIFYSIADVFYIINFIFFVTFHSMSHVRGVVHFRTSVTLTLTPTLTLTWP